MAILGAEVRTRDSKTPQGPVLVFSCAAWREFQTVVVRNGPERH